MCPHRMTVGGGGVRGEMETGSRMTHSSAAPWTTLASVLHPETGLPFFPSTVVTSGLSSSSQIPSGKGNLEGLVGRRTVSVSLASSEPWLACRLLTSVVAADPQPCIQPGVPS